MAFPCLGHGPIRPTPCSIRTLTALSSETFVYPISHTNFLAVLPNPTETRRHKHGATGLQGRGFYHGSCVRCPSVEWRVCMIADQVWGTTRCFHRNTGSA